MNESKEKQWEIDHTHPKEMLSDSIGKAQTTMKRERERESERDHHAAMNESWVDTTSQWQSNLEEIDDLLPISQFQRLREMESIAQQHCVVSEEMRKKFSNDPRITFDGVEGKKQIQVKNNGQKIRVEWNISLRKTKTNQRTIHS